MAKDQEMLELAQDWARKVWEKAVKSWKARSQDYNYRKFLARPAIESSLEGLQPVKNGVFLDLGCGEGDETRHIREFLVKQGSSGTLYGFDQQRELIQIAQERKEDRYFITTFYDHGRMEELGEKYCLKGKIHRIFSTFLLQDMPDAESHFEIVFLCLRKGGRGIFLLVHPDFGKKMLEKGVLKVNTELQSRLWKWAAEYPIVEENGKTFYVPYFQRNLADYLKSLRRRFPRVTFSEWRPSAKVIKKCERQHLSPFYDHPGNVYYPEILKIPSTVVFLVEK
ncbi:MAG: methyltransferase domain-containing protein [Candidatus Moraniibacteriota bacterium]